jgi:hypothetical protein
MKRMSKNTSMTSLFPEDLDRWEQDEHFEHVDYAREASYGEMED